MTSVVDKMATVYSKFHTVNVKQVKQDIIDRIDCTISDLCPVNHVVVEKLKEEWKKYLHELKCNLHPLDGFSKGVRDGLKTLDGEYEMQKLVGQDCCVANFLHALSKMKTAPKQT